jgi:hypothetical protein
MDGSDKPLELVRGIRPTPVTASSSRVIATNEKGRFVKTTGTGQGLHYGRTGLDELNATSGLSFYVYARKHTNGASTRIFQSGENASGHGFAANYDDTVMVTNGAYMHADNANGGATDYDVFGANSELRFHSASYSLMGGSSPGQWYYNGSPINTNTNITVTANANRFTRLWARRDGDTDGEQALNIILAFRGKLTAYEHKSLHENPWQVFAPRIHRIPIGYAAAAGGRIMSSLAGSGGLASKGGIAGIGGGLAG